jgi:hypothetical protein
MIYEAFHLAVWRYGRGGRLYRLALDNGMSASVLSATLSGARCVDYDERIIQIGEQLGLKPGDCFQSSGDVVAR